MLVLFLSILFAHGIEGGLISELHAVDMPNERSLPVCYSGYVPTAYEIYNENSETMYREFRYPIHNGVLPPFKLKRSKRYSRYQYHSVSSLQFAEGWLVGFSAGKFGGELTWYSSVGQLVQVIHEDRISNLVEIGERILVLESWLQMDLAADKYPIFEVTFESEVGKLRRWAVIDAAAVLIYALNENEVAIIDLKNNLSVFSSNGELLRKHQAVIGYSVAGTPDSIQSIDNLVYLGFYCGILEYNMITEEKRWLVEADNR